jgi:glycosyltransferase involved in cell wall biosynthesis
MNVANGFWLPLLALRGVPTVVNVDGIEWERAKWGRAAKAMFRLGARLTAKFATCLIADSLEIQRRWLVDFSRESTYIPYGGDASSVSVDVKPLERRKYVLAVARFVPENTIPEFLEATRRLAHAHEVVIVGSSGYGGALDETARGLADEFDSVHWLGHVADDNRLLSLWEQCGAYFHGHSVGGTNPALVQAMANGAPIVARDTVYNREVLGNAGEFCEPTPESIIKTIDRVMASADLQERLSHAARERMDDGFTWDAVCEKYEALLSRQIELTHPAKSVS